MGRSYLEAIFRHKYILVLPIILGLVAGAYVGLQASREYLANATIWTDTRVPAETTVGTTGGDSPPSAGQATLLTQLLATRSFLDGVLNESLLSADYARADQLEADSMLTELAESTAVSTPGPQLLSLAVVREDPDEAMGLTNAILDQFQLAQAELSTDRAEAQAEYDRKRLEAAEQALKASPDSEAAQDLFLEASEAYSASRLNLAAIAGVGLNVIDEPDTAYPQARRKGIALAAAAGLMAGMTLSLVALVLLMARDRSVRSEAAAVDAGFETIGSIPSFTARR